MEVIDCQHCQGLKEQLQEVKLLNSRLQEELKSLREMFHQSEMTLENDRRQEIKKPLKEASSQKTSIASPSAKETQILQSTVKRPSEGSRIQRTAVAVKHARVVEEEEKTNQQSSRISLPVVSSSSFGLPVTSGIESSTKSAPMIAVMKTDEVAKYNAPAENFSIGTGKINLDDEFSQNVYMLEYHVMNLRKKLPTYSGELQPSDELDFLKRGAAIKNFFNAINGVIENVQASQVHLISSHIPKMDPDVSNLLKTLALITESHMCPLLQEKVLYVLLDTNILLHNNRQLEKLFQIAKKGSCIKLLIPHVVLGELNGMKIEEGSIKNMHQQVVANTIAMLDDCYHKSGTFYQQSCQEDLLFRIFYCRCSRCSNDRRIIHAAEGWQHLGGLKKVLIASNDKGLRNISSESHGVLAFSMQNLMNVMDDIPFHHLTDFEVVQQKLFDGYSYDKFTFGPKPFVS